MRHVFHPEAALEFEEAVRFYRERGNKLAARLVAAVRTAIRQIIETPERWGILEEDVRRRLVRVFPYRVLCTPLSPTSFLSLPSLTISAPQDTGNTDWIRSRRRGRD